MHGDYANPDGSLPDHRYYGASLPNCADCHAAVGTAEDEIQMHGVHGDKLACQVCHSVSYTSCDGCHVGVSEETGNPFFRTEGDYLSFLIGRNTLQSEERPSELVLVRHIPIAPSSYEYYGENLLTNFDALPTWAYATPHNIQRETPQNASCEACHGNADLFLTEDKVAPDELNANLGVIVESPPPSLGEIGSAKPLSLPATHLGFSEDCLACHLSGVETVPSPPQDHAEYKNEDCSRCHNLP
jgi:thiosulfate/3-mercaptopyruvate sulfurtransferase